MNEIPEDVLQYKLCYVDGNLLYFTSDFDNVWGDDWDDAPWTDNAGEPYEKTDWTKDRKEYTIIKRIAFYDSNYACQLPLDCCFYSVADINKKAIAWLYNVKLEGLMAGSTMQQAIDWLKQVGVEWAILHK